MIFSGANHTSISGGTITSVQGNFHVHNTSIHEGKGIKLLHRKVASGAFHNSAERYDPPKCHEGTRKAILKELMDWIQDLDRLEFFLWLYGPAGAGKSAIAQTIAEMCYRAGFLAASFLFSRTAAGRNNDNLLIPTLAYQLTISIPEILEYVSSAVDKDPLIFTRSLEAQMEALIIQPLSKLPPDQYFENGDKSKSRPKFIIIDGLDECGQPKTQRYILTTLLSAIQGYCISLCFLIASRPEQEIHDAFNEDLMNSFTRRLVLDDKYQPDTDIKIFLTAKFVKIKQSHPLASYLPPSWPSDSDIVRLIQKSSGQFIYASTVMKFVESSRHRPTDRLDIIFGLTTPGKNTPFAALDALYTHIFASVENIEAVTGVFLLLNYDFKIANTTDLFETFLFYKPGDLQIILADLHSVIFVPSPQNKSDQLRIFHASLGDFLMDKSRSGRFFIDTPEANALMAEYCIKHMSAAFETSNISSTERSHWVISYRSFFNHFPKAYPTEELLRALHYFNFAMFLHLLTNQTVFAWNYIVHHLPCFFHWLQNQCSSTHDNGDLYRLYLAPFDSYLHAQLSHYPSEPYFYCLIAGLTLNSFSYNSHHVIHIIARDILDYERRSLHEIDKAGLHLVELSHVPRQDYTSLLIAFFTDSTRSGRYYVDRSMYIDLAIKSVEYISCPETDDMISNKRTHTERYASEVLQDIFFRLPRDSQLAAYLRKKTIRSNVYRRNFIIQTIEAYMKECNARVAEVSTSEGNSLGTPTGSIKSRIKYLFKRKKD